MKAPYITLDNEVRIIPNNQFSDLMVAIIKRGKTFRFKAFGWSMSPLIKDGDVITLISAEIIHIGDILAFINPNGDKLMIHRVVARNGHEYLLKADNSSQPDGWVNINQIVGLVNKIERGGQRKNFGLGWEKWILAQLSRSNVLRLSNWLFGGLCSSDILRFFK